VTTQISALGRAERGSRAVAPVSNRAVVPTVKPVPRIALTQEACVSFSYSEESIAEHVRHYLWVVCQRRKRLFPVAELWRVVDEICSEPG
jgi:hypothetical protein